MKRYIRMIRKAFDRIHFRDTEIDIGDGKIRISPTVKFLAAWGIFLVILLLYLAIAKPFQGKEKKDPDTGVVIGENGEAYVPISRNEYPEINSFVDSYLNALTTADINLIGTMVVDPTQFDAEKLQQRAQKILHYSNVDCYTAEGLDEGTYVVYAIVNTQIAGIDIQPLSLHRFYLVPNEYGGFLQDNTVGEDGLVSYYLEQLDKNPDVIKLYERVNTNNAESAAQDENLRAFYNELGIDVSVPAATAAPEGDPATAAPEGDPATAAPEGDPATAAPEGDTAAPEADPAAAAPEGEPAAE